MPHYMLQFNYTHSSVKGMTANPSDRHKIAVGALAPLGATVKEFYFTFGESDVVLIYEAPGPVAAVALAMTLGAAGSVTNIKTTPLITAHEAKEAMALSGKTQASYKPPTS